MTRGEPRWPAAVAHEVAVVLAGAGTGDDGSMDIDEMPSDGGGPSDPGNRRGAGAWMPSVSAALKYMTNRWWVATLA